MPEVRHHPFGCFLFGAHEGVDILFQLLLILRIPFHMNMLRDIVIQILIDVPLGKIRGQGKKALSSPRFVSAMPERSSHGVPGDCRR